MAKLKSSFFLFELLSILAVICGISEATTLEKLVSSSLDAEWFHTSLLAETSEFFANEDLAKFWSFIDKITDQVESQTQIINHEQEFERAQELAISILEEESNKPDSSISLLRFALALRLYSPRVQLHRQIAGDFAHILIKQHCSKQKPFYEINGIVSCNLVEIETHLDNAEQRKASLVYSVDHVYPHPTISAPIAILYADISNPQLLQPFHQKFVELAKQARLRYVFRHFDGNFSSFTSTSSEFFPVSLSGYGVELAIKSTEYKAIDDSLAKEQSNDEIAPTDLHGFNFRLLRDKYVYLRDQLQQFQMNLAELDELTPLKQWEIADIGMQAAQRIMDATTEEALSIITDLSQNFPIRARSLVQTKVRQSLRDEIAHNQQMWSQELEINEGECAMWINGIPVAQDVESLDPFQLFQTLRQEQRLADAFMQLGYKREYQSVLQAMDLSEDKSNTWALDYREGKPEWLNNLDKDKQYADWGNSVRLLLQPYFPGMIRPIARNLFSLVCILDLASPESPNVIKTAFSLYTHNVPMRIGFIFVVNNSLENGKENIGVALYNVFQFVKADKGSAKAIHFIQRLFDELGDNLSSNDLPAVHAFFKRHYTDQEIDDVFGTNSDYSEGRANGQSFFARSGLQNLPTILVNGIPLDASAVSESAERFEEAIVIAVMRQTSDLQRAVMSGKLTDRENVQNWIMTRPEVLPRLNPRLLGVGHQMQKPVNAKLLKTPNIFTPIITAEEECQKDKISLTQLTSCLMRDLHYLVRSDEIDVGKQQEARWLTVWIFADLETIDGQHLMQNALKALKKSNQMRLVLIHNGETENVPITQLVDAIIHRLSSMAAKQLLNKLLGSIELLDAIRMDSNFTNIHDKITSHGVNMESVWTEINAGKGKQRLRRQSLFAQQQMGLTSGERAIFVNGEFYGPLEKNEQFEPEDFALFEKLAEKRGTKAVAALVKEWHKPQTNDKKSINNENHSDTVFHVLTIVNAFAVRKRRQTIDLGMEFESVLNLPAENDENYPVLEITAIVDPLSKSAQKLAPILQTLLKVLNADLKLAMNPKQQLSELPLKRFYRYVLPDKPEFGPNGQMLPNIAQFRELPQKQLLTMNLIVPNAWMVQPIKAEYDLDNIRIAMASKDVVARFQLRHILLEGHCFDDQTGSPPRGLQFVLGTRTEPAIFDTIVMANLGYFQLKAGPGAWILRLRDGKSKEIYEIKGSIDAEEFTMANKTAMTNGNTGELEELHVLVDSFSGKTIRVRVAKHKGMEKRNLLAEDEKGAPIQDEYDEDDDAESDSIWSNLAPKKMVSKLSSKLMGTQKYDTINIFSLASGHLYERFMRIMILSVMRNTKHPVKFWLLNNYLSPQFRETLPILAKNYHFDYQLIEYKWPRWLHQQTEKQRVMWGYKILFLDVLFPLDIKKIIFVDADQIVRTDLMELMEYDLHGAPYGYTPFCESRTSMDGFRFWKHGYWATHLAGRKYHISALYVVDLVKFRQIAAGDRLRGQYQGLSADPNSLANLDQDLPNNMIHQVRIHSLPQEWLWCETWCDDASKAKAKTIDLCNNPQTKEPKLDSAMRIVPEWIELDNEIKRVLANATSFVEESKAVDENEEEMPSNEAHPAAEEQPDMDEHSEL